MEKCIRCGNPVYKEVGSIRIKRFGRPCWICDDCLEETVEDMMVGGTLRHTDPMMFYKILVLQEQFIEQKTQH